MFGYHAMWLKDTLTKISGSEEAVTKQISGLHTTLSGLRRYTNYSVTVCAFTAAGDGVRAAPVYCHTEEDGKRNSTIIQQIIFPNTESKPVVLGRMHSTDLRNFPASYVAILTFLQDFPLQKTFFDRRLSVLENILFNYYVGDSDS